MNLKSTHLKALKVQLYGPTCRLGKVSLGSSVVCNHLTSSLSLSARQSSTLAQSNKDTPTLALLSDAAQLLRSQTTKLSLLAINSPFTPSALTTVLKETNDGALPSLVTAALLIGDSTSYPAAFYDEARYLVKNTLQEYAKFLSAVKTFACAHETAQIVLPDKQSVTVAAGRIWSACDVLASFARDGVVMFAIKKAHMYLELVKDGIRELDEWDPEGEDDADDFFLDDGLDDETPSLDKRDISKSSTDDSDTDTNTDNDGTRQLAQRKQKMLRVLRTVAKIYPAIETYRLKPLAKKHSDIKQSSLPQTQISQLASLLSTFRTLADFADEATGCLYDSDPDESARNLVEVMNCAKRAVDFARSLYDNVDQDQKGPASDDNDKYVKWADALLKVLGGLERTE
ncbi:hypothetical protein KEM54_002917 [Ascosphaera aggregata]|nr:hypothetical protein KEM54_002917 [Ascosphaera aggregata]